MCYCSAVLISHEGNVLTSLWVRLLQQLKEDLDVLRREVLPSGEANINLPVNLKRLIWNAKERFQCNNNRSGPTGRSRIP